MSAAETCVGSGRGWGIGTGAPICPVCLRGPRSLGVPRPARRKGGGRFTGTTPVHERRTS